VVVGEVDLLINDKTRDATKERRGTWSIHSVETSWVFLWRRGKEKSEFKTSDDGGVPPLVAHSNLPFSVIN
jgi:hypothetical protein